MYQERTYTPGITEASHIGFVPGNNTTTLTRTLHEATNCGVHITLFTPVIDVTRAIISSIGDTARAMFTRVNVTLAGLTEQS